MYLSSSYILLYVCIYLVNILEMKILLQLQTIIRVNIRHHFNIFCFILFFQCCIPDPNELRNFVIKPQLPENTRLHCTMIRHNEKTAKNTTGNGTTSAASLSENSSNNNTTSTSNESEAEKLGQTSAYTLYLGKKKNKTIQRVFWRGFFCIILIIFCPFF